MLLSSPHSISFALTSSSLNRGKRPFTLHRIVCCANPSQEMEERKEALSTHGISSKVVGVLGGGQLGRMLCQAASQMAIKVMVLDPLEHCPASMLSYHHMIGNYDQSDTVQEFATRCEVLTVEIEHVDAVTLEKLEQKGIDCQPKASTIRIIQDKYLQKLHFSKHGIPVSDFVEIIDFETAINAGESFGYPLMIKSKCLAYDGRGNAIAYGKEDLSSAVSALGGYDRGLYAEQWVDFVKELAVIVARGRDGSISCYPVVETIHKDNICHIVKAPANVSWKVRKLAISIAEKAITSLEGAGIFAVEMFLTRDDTRDDQILLNEVAPRPHNSGHHTIESCHTSQFEQHLRAILGLPLGDSSMKVPYAIMYNLLGEAEGELGFHFAQQLMTKALSIPGANVHWYDKPEMRKLRKMGHITIVGPSMQIVESRLESMLNGKPFGDVVGPCVAIIMGSDSDLLVMKGAAEALEFFGVHFEVTIVSAHRTPERMFSFASSAEGRGVQVIIAGAGGAAHLPGMVASLSDLPVIGVPVKTTALTGVDSMLSILQMPKGVPVATVAIDNSTNAALLAVRILARSDDKLRERLIQYREEMKDTVLQKADKLEGDGWEKYSTS